MSCLDNKEIKKLIVKLLYSAFNISGNDELRYAPLSYMVDLDDNVAFLRGPYLDIAFHKGPYINRVYYVRNNGFIIESSLYYTKVFIYSNKYSVMPNIVRVIAHVKYDENLKLRFHNPKFELFREPFIKNAKALFKLLDKESYGRTNKELDKQNAKEYFGYGINKNKSGKADEKAN